MLEKDRGAAAFNTTLRINVIRRTRVTGQGGKRKKKRLDQADARPQNINGEAHSAEGKKIQKPRMFHPWILRPKKISGGGTRLAL